MKILKRPRAVLMNKSNKKPLLWSSLANKYRDDIVSRPTRLILTYVARSVFLSLVLLRL